MAKYSYSTAIGEKESAAVGIALPISTKQVIEICNFLRGKKLERAKAMLSDVIAEKYAVPFRRFTNGPGHKPGIAVASGSYPKKACGEILKLLNSAQANSQFKGLSSADLVVRHISAQRGAKTVRYGRRRREAKRTTVEVVLAEVVEAKPKKAGKKSAEKPAKEEKKEAKKEGATDKVAKEKENIVEQKAKAQESKPEPKTENKEEPKTPETKPEPKKENSSQDNPQKTKENVKE